MVVEEKVKEGVRYGLMKGVQSEREAMVVRGSVKDGRGSEVASRPMMIFVRREVQIHNTKGNKGCIE